MVVVLVERREQKKYGTWCLRSGESEGKFRDSKTGRIVVSAGCCWLTSVILATQKAEIRRIVVRSHLGASAS
jgi:hypothetical protein